MNGGEHHEMACRCESCRARKGELPPDFRERCPMAPDEAMGWHEVMPSERRCVYCGIALAPVQCNGCGKFMSNEEIIKNESRCSECA